MRRLAPAAPVARGRRMQQLAGAHRIARSRRSGVPCRRNTSSLRRSTTTPPRSSARAGSTPRGYDSIAELWAEPARAPNVALAGEDYGLREVSAWPIDPLHMHCAVLEVPDGTDRPCPVGGDGAGSGASSWRSRCRVLRPAPSTTTIPMWACSADSQQMDVAEAHPWSRGEGVKVAIIDTGADIGHPDLRANIASAANFVDSDDRQFQRDRHGTEMAGVIAAVANNGDGIVGIAPAARLLAVQGLLADCGPTPTPPSCNSFTLARALVAAFDAHAQIVNLSLAGPADPLLNDLISEGLRRGVLFVGAASAEPADGRGGLLHQPGVIEVASSRDSVRARIGAVCAGPGNPDSVARRPLRLRIGGLDRDGASERRPGAAAGEKSGPFGDDACSCCGTPVPIRAARARWSMPAPRWYRCSAEDPAPRRAMRSAKWPTGMRRASRCTDSRSLSE